MASLYSIQRIYYDRRFNIKNTGEEDILKAAAKFELAYQEALLDPGIKAVHLLNNENQKTVMSFYRDNMVQIQGQKS